MQNILQIYLFGELLAVVNEDARARAGLFAVQKPFFKTAALGGVLRQLAVRLLKVLCEHTPLVEEHIVFLAVVNIEVTDEIDHIERLWQNFAVIREQKPGVAAEYHRLAIEVFFVKFVGFFIRFDARRAVQRTAGRNVHVVNRVTGLYRIGEMLGLTWDCIDIAPQSIENGSAYIFVNKELQRVTRGALDDLSDKGVIKKFPPCIASTHTALVLKEPKTKTSIRRVYLPKTVAYMLVERKKEIDELMDLFGDEYIDNNLVFCSSNGRPMESQVINRAFNKLIKENGLPHVVFHSLRHSSITYKLKLNGGDMKSVQGDSGHAQVKMVADVYSHIIDEDRCINAQRLEKAFYSSKTPDTPDPVEDTEPKTADTAVTESDAAKILELLKNPETAALLKQLAKAL